VNDPAKDLLAVNAAFYEAFENADFDSMRELWATDDGVVCVHPANRPIRGYQAVMRSWVALMASAPYIQFFLTDVEAVVVGELGSVTCTENVLSAGTDTPDVASFAGASAAATNVFRLTPEGWRLWIHHASPVLSSPDADPDEPTEGGAS